MIPFFSDAFRSASHRLVAALALVFILFSFGGDSSLAAGAEPASVLPPESAAKDLGDPILPHAEIPGTDTANEISPVEGFDESIRLWMLGESAAGPGAQPDGLRATSAVLGTPDVSLQTSLDLWERYFLATQIPKSREREDELEDLLGEDVPPSLRHVLTRDVASSLEFQSRRAEFVRRYGFYANWFNRVTTTASRALQGNVQAAAQLVVDATFDVFDTREMTPSERRVLRLLNRLEAQGKAGTQERERIAKLERKLAEARAGRDLERARWELREGNPRQALFYATAAQIEVEDNKRARAVQKEAREAVARRRRERLASDQVGYPDRTPPIRLHDPELLRLAVSSRSGPLSVELASLNRESDEADTAHVARASGVAPDADERLLLKLLTTLPDRDTAAVMVMRDWAATLQDAGYGTPDRLVWLAQTLQSRRFNPDLRLARAQASRRDALARFIFVGPDSARERTYAFSSRLASAYDALASVGVFYVFEVFYRAAVVALSPPPPASEVLDASAAFLAASPAGREQRETARWMAREYLKTGQYDKARSLLHRYGELDVAKGKEIRRLEAKSLLAAAERWPPGSSERAAVLARVSQLVPGTALAARALRLAEQAPLKGEPIRVEVPWTALRLWFGQPMPRWFPGDPAWVDGAADNGEVDSKTFWMEAEGESAEMIFISFPVARPSGRSYEQSWLALKPLPEKAREWLRSTLAERLRQDRLGTGLARPRIPYSLSGGVGLTGVDFYPKLLPLEASETGFSDEPSEDAVAP